MKAYYVIFGILAFVVGIVCLINPFSSFMAISFMISVFLLLVGIFFIMMYFMQRKQQFIAPNIPAVGFAGIFFGIAMVLISILSFAVPNIREVLDMVILIVFAAWLIMNGILSIFTGMSLRKQDMPGTVLAIVLGVIMVAGGIYGLLHMVIFGEALGLALGILLLIYGLNLICSAFMAPDSN